MEIKKILCALDDSPLTERVFEVALKLSQKLETELALVSIINPGPTSDGIDVETLRSYLRTDIMNLFERLLEKQGHPNIFKFIENGDPKKKIVEIAKEWQADLIVMGSHGRSGLTRVLMGSVAESIVRHAPCPVVIVPTPK